MYKIVLHDMNTPPFYTGAVCYYVEDIDEFQKAWFLIETDDGTKERFLKCKDGEYQCDLPFVTEEEDLCMIQAASDYKCLYEKVVEYSDVDAEILNGYDYPSSMHIKNIKIFYRFILFKGQIKQIARFKLKGIYCDSPFERLSKNKFVSVHCYGNTVIKVKDKFYGPMDSNEPTDYDEVEMESIAYKELCSFAECDAETFAVPEEVFSDENEKKADLQILLEDIVGEAG